MNVFRIGIVAAALVAAPLQSRAANDSVAPSDPSTSRSSSVSIAGSDSTPFVVTRPANERRGEDLDRAAHSRNEVRLVEWTVALALGTLGLAIFTALLWWENRRLIRETSRASAESLREAGRSADALQTVGHAMKTNTENMERVIHQQMRAYIAVEPGLPLHQDDRFRFGSKPEIINTGLTPARNVRYRIQSAVLDFPTSPTYVFPDTVPFTTHDATLSPRQKFIANSAVNVRYSDADVEQTKLGQSKRLFTWGTVTYEDVFGDRWETDFCHHFDWYTPKDSDKLLFETFYHTSHNTGT